MSPAGRPARPTIRDVAEAAGVSMATVTHALNHNRYVKAQTRAHVLEVVERLGYRPSRVARSLRTSKTETLALILPPVESASAGRSPLEYYALVTHAATLAAFNRGYR